MATTAPITHRFAPVLAVSVGIALFSGMDAAIKGGSLAVGVYTALVLRNMMGLGMILPVWLLRARRRPPPEVIRLHIIRSVVSAGMAILFFVAIVRLPIAEGIAITFIAPLIALLLAGVFLKERIHRRALHCKGSGQKRCGSGAAIRRQSAGPNERSPFHPPIRR